MAPEDILDFRGEKSRIGETKCSPMDTNTITKTDKELLEFLALQKQNQEIFKTTSEETSQIKVRIEELETELRGLKRSRGEKDRLVEKFDQKFSIYTSEKLDLNKERFPWDYVSTKHPLHRNVSLKEITLRVYFSAGQDLPAAQILVKFDDLHEEIDEFRFSTIGYYEELFSQSRERYDLGQYAWHTRFPESTAPLPILDLSKFSDEEREKLFFLPQIKLIKTELGL